MKHCILMAAAVCLAAPAWGAQVQHCLDIETPHERLACYDAAHGRSESAPAAASPARAAADFGLEQQARRASEAAAPSTISSVVLTAERDAHGYFAVVLENGQRWQAKGTAPAAALKTGDRVTIRRAAFGSYLMTNERGGAALRVRRTE